MAFTAIEPAKIRMPYCTLDEMAADLGDIGLRDDILSRFILPASQYLLNEIGQFIPTFEVKLLTGNGKADLVIPPLLEISSAANNGHVVASDQYVLEPTTRMWKHGPYVKISLETGLIMGVYWLPIKNSVELVGLWGLWEQLAPSGTTVKTNQAIDAETLEVPNAGLISPGMVVLIENEMQFVSGTGSPAAAVTALNAACDNQTETLSVASSANLYAGEILRIDFEQMKVLDKKTGKASVARGWAGTTKTAHSSSADVDVYKVFTVERAVNGTSAAAHAANAVIKRYKVPEDINYLTRQIATLMMKKAQTGYAGRSGNSETGETFYNFEFPRDAIARVKKNYEIPHLR